MATAAEMLAEARTHQAAGRTGVAETLCRRVLAREPRHPGACLQLGSLVIGRDPRAGLAYFEQAYATDAEYPGAKTCLVLGHVAIGAWHGEREEREAMLVAYRRAIALDPDHAGAHWNLANALLQQGAFDEGWREYEWRWRWRGFADRPRGFKAPQWRGEPIEGARILLHAEQGLGDAIQFARYAPMVAERGASVVLEVDRRLVRLMSALPGVVKVVARGEPLPAVDWQCPLMSLPLAFGTTVETVPCVVPYLPGPGEAGVGDGAPREMRRVGLVWAGSPTHLRDERRSIDLSLFRPLTQVPGLRWFSLQMGPAAEALATHAGGGDIGDLTPGIRDFADTAAIVRTLDLVITVDTSVAHLAGALGTPVWVLVPRPSDWRWLLERDNSPWYPTATLFRQRAPGDWAPVVERVHEALHALVAAQFR